MRVTFEDSDRVRAHVSPEANISGANMPTSDVTLLGVQGSRTLFI
jgi:hypothetical protein